MKLCSFVMTANYLFRGVRVQVTARKECLARAGIRLVFHYAQRNTHTTPRRWEEREDVMVLGKLYEFCVAAWQKEREKRRTRESERERSRRLLRTQRNLALPVISVTFATKRSTWDESNQDRIYSSPRARAPRFFCISLLYALLSHSSRIKWLYFAPVSPFRAIPIAIASRSRMS